MAVPALVALGALDPLRLRRRIALTTTEELLQPRDAREAMPVLPSIVCRLEVGQDRLDFDVRKPARAEALGCLLARHGPTLSAFTRVFERVRRG